MMSSLSIMIKMRKDSLMLLILASIDECRVSAIMFQSEHFAMQTKYCAGEAGTGKGPQRGICRSCREREGRCWEVEVGQAVT